MSKVYAKVYSVLLAREKIDLAKVTGDGSRHLRGHLSSHANTHTPIPLVYFYTKR